MLRWGLGTETQASEVSSGKRSRVASGETARGAREQCATGGGMVWYGLGSGTPWQREPRRKSCPQDKQGTIVGESEKRRGRRP